jgi:restriction system protein
MQSRALREARELERQGFTTPCTRDGGVDIYAAKSDMFGPLLYVVECKKYKSRPVGIEVVQRVYASLKQETQQKVSS